MASKLNVDKLDLSLPEQKQKKDRSSSFLILLGLILIVLTAFNSYLIYCYAGRRSMQTAESGLTPEKLKALALKLEKQNLRKTAVSAWQDYLTAAALADQEKSRIWYRIGRLFQEDHDYQQALDAYYRSESLARPKSLEVDLNRRVQESLSALGEFSALKNELADRVAADTPDQAKSDQIVAEIGQDKITKAQFDGWIEQQLKLQLDTLAAGLSEEQRKEQKRELLKTVSSGMQQKQLLSQMVGQELLYRKAFKQGLADQAEVKSLMEQAKRSLLIQQLLARKMAQEIRLTESDLKSYFDSHQQDFAGKEFDQAKGEIYQLLYRQEESKVQQQFLEQLHEEFNVALHFSKLGIVEKTAADEQSEGSEAKK